MNTFQKIIKNITTAFMVTAGICLIALVIELGIFITDWFQVKQPFSIFSKKGVQTEKSLEDTQKSYPDVNSLCISSGSFNLSIKQDSSLTEPAICYEKTKGKLSFKQDDKTLYIKEKRTYNLYSLFHKKEEFSIASGTIYVFIPKDYAMENVELHLGTATTSLDKFYTKNLIIQGDSGTLTAEGTIAQNANLIMAGGQSQLQNVIFHNYTLETGSGEFLCSGQFASGGDFQIGAGDATLVFFADRNYYGLNLEKGEGDLLIDGTDYEDVPITDNPSHTITLKNETGNVNLIFQRQ